MCIVIRVVSCSVSGRVVYVNRIGMCIFCICALHNNILSIHIRFDVFMFVVVSLFVSTLANITYRVCDCIYLQEDGIHVICMHRIIRQLHKIIFSCELIH